ncbi:MAG: hypothetical protein HYR98_04145 [Nitrospirae bacterium]|nr:hypothetical protein [Nitrospirota bacterium]
MPRQARLDVPGALHHIMVQGINKSYKIALVAAGRCDLMVSFKPKSEWDIAAGVLIVEEAGGRVTDHEGNPYRFNRPDTIRPNLLATNGLLHAAALRFIRDVNRRAGKE